MKMEIGDLVPLRRMLADLAEWEERVRARPLPEADPVAQALGAVRAQLEEAIEAARDIELDLTTDQYAQVRGLSKSAVYKRLQRGQLPEAQMRGGKLVVPLRAVAGVSA
jgi:hypothetical protein